MNRQIPPARLQFARRHNRQGFVDRQLNVLADEETLFGSTLLLNVAAELGEIGAAIQNSHQPKNTPPASQQA